LRKGCIVSERAAGSGANADGGGTHATGPPARVRWARLGYAVLASAFVACVVVQVFFAGLGVFVAPENWAWHVNFVHFFEWLPPLMLLAAFLGRLPRGLKWPPAGMFVLIALQYATANLNRGVVAALHPVVALLIFLAAVVVARRAWRALSGADAAREGASSGPASIRRPERPT